MKKMRNGGSNGVCLVSCKVFLAYVLFSAVAQLYAIPPRLHVEGNRVKDPDGNIVVLRGISMIDLGCQEVWYGGATALIDRITDLNDSNGDSPGWYTKIIRIPVFPPEGHTWPYEFNPNDLNSTDNNNLYDLLRTVVDYCAQKEVYAAIDWHDIANTYDEVAETNAFWTYMAPKFKDDSHVIFELFCEPINQGGTTDAAKWSSVKTDMETWISTIRASAPDTLLFVGTPSYCQIMGPTADNPVSDNNVVYTTHIYPLHWLSNNQYHKTDITTAVAKHPVILGEWGFTSDTNYDDQWHIVIGTKTNYGQPIKEFVEGLGIGNMAWCAGAWDWSPPIFYKNWTLRTGEGEMGGFAKEWLFETSGVTQDINLNITKCNVTAGKTQGRNDTDYNNIKDIFEASGTFASSPLALSSVTHIDVNIVSLADGNEVLIYPGTINFSSTQVKNRKYKYTHKIPKGGEGAITSLTMDFNKKTFAIKAQNVDLTGLGCPLRLDITMGSYILTGDANETVVNGKKTLIPTRFMRTHKDTLVVNKAKAKHNITKALSDTLSVTGDIAVIYTDVNLCNYDVNFVWGNQLFNVAPGKFKASKTGHLYKCTKDANDANGYPGVVTAQVDIDKATFTLSVKDANAIDAASASIPFGISFADFNEMADVCRVTGRSW